MATLNTILANSESIAINDHRFIGQTISRNQRIFDCYDGSSGSSTGVFLDNDVITLDYGRGSGAKLVTTQVLRDVSAWYHLVAVFDSSNATSSNRLKLYLNGSQITTFSTAIYPSQNALNNWMSANSNNRIGSSWDGSANFSGYITEVNFIDGQALTPSSFGETNAQTGVWQPKAYSGSYGTNGFYLNFSDNSNTTAATLGKDYSGNGNNWTPNNFSVTAGAGNDSLVDSPTSYGTDTGVGGTVRGNYSTLNPLFNATTLTNGNLDASLTSASTTGTFGASSSKWYFECRVNSKTDLSATDYLGIANETLVKSDSSFSYSQVYVYLSNAQKGGNGGSGSYGASWTVGDVIGVAYDLDAGSITFYKNGTSQGVAYSTGFTAGSSWRPFLYASGGTNTFTFNFGQRPFAYTAPSGYKALCTQNLPTPTIGATTATQAGKYFGVTLRTGGAPSGGTYTTTVDMSNGALLWDKGRNGAQNNYLVDSNRGLTSFLQSNSTSAEATQANWYTSFGNGTYSTGSTDWGSSVSLVDWIWAAGANTTNTAGSITSTVSANTTSGFSVVTYAGNSTLGATVGHGLGVAPSMIIVKSRSAATNWPVYHTSIGNTKALFLNLTNATDTDNYWNNTSPTSTVFSLNASTGLNSSGSNYVAYCFSPVSGYSAFGSWTGNGSADGPFVFTGFRPAYILWKRTDSSAGGDWGIVDATRNPSNVVGEYLAADLSGAGATFSMLDMVSNGFKIRWSDTSTNASGGTYIFMALASNPFKYSLAR